MSEVNQEILGADLGSIWILLFDFDEIAEWLKQHAGGWIPRQSRFKLF